MAADYIDLHSHSTASDGTFAPAEVAQLARRAGLAGWGLTDHDTSVGLVEAREESRKLGIEFVPGIEISCVYPKPGTMHLLGYCVDPASPVLADMSRQLIEFRDTRNPKIIARLQELGISITMEEVERESGGQVVGRPHIASVLVRKGYSSSIKQAFDKYLGQGGAAYFDKERLPARQAFDRVRKSGGLVVLAHPIQLCTENDAQLERIVKDLVDMGLDGIEVMHSDHTPDLVEKYLKLADRYGLLKTGGSDFHGNNKKEIELGFANKQRVPRQFMDQLLARSRWHGHPAHV